MRPSNRKSDEIRQVTIEPNVNPYAEGSCLIKIGNTHVLCTATVEENVPPFLRGKGSGWVTAEYSMLPRATHSRTRRESAQGKVSGRTQEIQRLIGRCMRSVVDLKALGERQIIIDCDVIQADGGTRTASITGGFVALSFAIKKLLDSRVIKQNPVIHSIAAISCGILDGEVIADLEYTEDSKAEVDANFVMTSEGKLVEIQSTAEQKPFSVEQFSTMMQLAENAIKQLTNIQLETLTKSL